MAKKKTRALAAKENEQMYDMALVAAGRDLRQLGTRLVQYRPTTAELIGMQARLNDLVARINCERARRSSFSQEVACSFTLAPKALSRIKG